MIAGPLVQIAAQLKWFGSRGVSIFDLAVRAPRVRDANYNDDNWMWIDRHRNIDVKHLEMKVIPWARWMNKNGADVYLRPTASREAAVLFLDDVPIDKALCVAKKYSSCVVETSPGNTQIWLATTKPLSVHVRGRAQAYLRSLGYTDPGSTSGDHFGRLCGVKSQKRRCWVNLNKVTEGPAYEAIITTQQTSLPRPKGGGERASSTEGKSMSEKEFGWVCGQLRAGARPESVLRDLESSARARGKRDFRQYAHRTVQKALAVI